MYKIDKNIPVKSSGKGAGGGKPPTYPWRQMEIGDSFLFPVHVYPTLAHTLCAQASSTNHPKKFITRKTEEGYRCWRTE